MIDRFVAILVVVASPLIAFGQGVEPKPAGTEASREFATRLAGGMEILARRYYRGLDEDQMAIDAIRGLYKSAGQPLPKALEDRLPKSAGKFNAKQSLDDQIAQALKELSGPLNRPERLALLVEARDRLGERKDLVAHDVAAAIKAVTDGLDPNTTFLTPERMTRTRIRHPSISFGELGIDLQRREKDDVLVVVTPVKGSPAHVAGIRAGDAIVETAKLDEDGLDRLLLGKKGEKVRLVVERDGKTLEFNLERDAVKRESIVGVERRADDSWSYVVDEKLGIYYVRILNYARPDMGRDLGHLLTEFEKNGMKGLILDLRFTETGYIDGAVAVAEQFIDKGPIVTFRWRTDGFGQRSGGRGSHRKFPMTCLVTSHAGTCTEIVAGCLQDSHRAAIVGERTSGRASVQNYSPFEGGMLRITTSHAFRPNGKPLDRSVALEAAGTDWGVVPDEGLAVELPRAERDALKQELFRQTLLRQDAVPPPAGFRDRQREAAIEYLRHKVTAGGGAK